MNPLEPESQAWPPPPPREALQCPRCGAPAKPADAAQTCGCGQRFVLRAGAFLDRAVQTPPLDPKAEAVVVKGSGMVRRYGRLDPDAIVEGALDPVFARLPMTATKLSYRAIYTIAVWRRIAWASVLAILCVPLPFTWVLVVAYRAEPFPGLLALAVGMGVLTVTSLVSVFLVPPHYVRVVGAKDTLTIRFDRPMFRRRKFHDELLRRSGISPSPIP